MAFEMACDDAPKLASSLKYLLLYRLQHFNRRVYATNNVFGRCVHIFIDSSLLVKSLRLLSIHGLLRKRYPDYVTLLRSDLKQVEEKKDRLKTSYAEDC